MALLPTEKTWGKNKKDIKYLNRDFASLRQALIEFTKTYYADTFNDFNESSPGMMFLEQAAYVGDVLSYYTDAQLKESFINLAGNYNNILIQAQNLGYKPKLSKPATTTLTVYQTVPNIGVGANNRPDYTYALKIKQGMQVLSKKTNGTTFITTDDVDFNDPTDREVSVFQTSGNEASFYLLTKKVKAISAQVITQTFDVGDFVKNPTFRIEDTSFISIEKVTDSNGNVYYEVPYLAQEMVYIKIPNVESNDPQLSQYRSTVPYLLKLLKTPRRFTTKVITNSLVELRFGGGSANVSDEILVPSTKNVGFGETFTVTLTNAAGSDGTTVPYTISGVTSADINGASLTGNFILSGGTANLIVVTVASLPLSNKIFSITANSITRNVSITYLVSGTLPSAGGVSALTGVVADGPVTEIEIASSVSQTGVFVNSNVRPVLSPVVTSTSDVSVTTATSLSQTGIFVYAAARPVLAGFSSITLGQSGSGPVIATPPATRQILIR
jgi:hypothetical protein